MTGYTQVLGPDGQVKADVVSRDADGVYVATSLDCPPWMEEGAQAYQVWLAAGNAPAAPPAPSRTVKFTTLVDALSSAQYAAIDARDRDRMQSENGGIVPFSSSKIGRAAKALGMSPDDLFKLAGA